LIGEEGLSRYYRYDGSLTTPRCYESVIWSVLAEPLKLSYNQLNAFRNLSDEKNGFMKNTYRPVQEIGTRKLFRSFRSKPIGDGSNEYISTAGNRVQCLPIYMKIFIVLISFLMMII
jgi:carbonic anhydrase